MLWVRRAARLLFRRRTWPKQIPGRGAGVRGYVADLLPIETEAPVWREDPNESLAAAFRYARQDAPHTPHPATQLAYEPPKPPGDARRCITPGCSVTAVAQMTTPDWMCSNGHRFSAVQAMHHDACTDASALRFMVPIKNHYT